MDDLSTVGTVAFVVVVFGLLLVAGAYVGLQPNLCTWCGHPDHGRRCPSSIVTGAGRAGHPDTAPCPCARGVA